jgi:hypothetical protein
MKRKHGGFFFEVPTGPEPIFGGRIQEGQGRDQTYLRQKPVFAAF